MSTRGLLKVRGRYYYLRSDSYPSAAWEFFRCATAKSHGTAPQVSLFIRRLNACAGFKWASPMSRKEGQRFEKDTLFCEYIWSVDLATGSMRMERGR